MEQTLQDSDRLIILKIGRSWARITRKPYIPKRGEVIIFVKHDSLEHNRSSDRQLIKRVIGLPGERVLVEQGKVWVYNDEFPNGFQPDKLEPYGQTIEKTSGQIDITVPKNEVFVLGDNRDNSLDSRSFGTVESKDIVGKLSLRIYPFGKLQAY